MLMPRATCGAMAATRALVLEEKQLSLSNGGRAVVASPTRSVVPPPGVVGAGVRCRWVVMVVCVPVRKVFFFFFFFYDDVCVVFTPHAARV